MTRKECGDSRLFQGQLDSNLVLLSALFIGYVLYLTSETGWKVSRVIQHCKIHLQVASYGEDAFFSREVYAITLGIENTVDNSRNQVCIVIETELD